MIDEESQLHYAIKQAKMEAERAAVSASPAGAAKRRKSDSDKPSTSSGGRGLVARQSRIPDEKWFVHPGDP